MKWHLPDKWAHGSSSWKTDEFRSMAIPKRCSAIPRIRGCVSSCSMSTDGKGRLGYVEVSGSHRDIGIQLGRFGAEIAHRHLVATHAWTSVMAHRGTPAASRMHELVAARFPAYYQELTGLAEGLSLPFDDVFLWNCRGDVWASAPDGCTTVQIPGAAPLVAHNEDGDPGFAGHCALARISPAGGKAFAAF